MEYFKYIYNLAFKMAISATVALIIGNMLGLQYATVGAVISILSIQDTRKKALIISYKRIIACSLGILLSVILYGVLGNGALAFGLFLIILIPLTSRLKVQEGMVPAVVLSTHFLVANRITTLLIVNEILLMIIGIGVAAIANIFMPSLEDKFKEDKEWIEEHYRIIIHKIAKSLITYSVDIDEQKLMDEIRQREDVILFIDEIHTPDSSRYFYSEGYEERFAKGEPQKQLSKEFVREWLMDNGFQGKEGQQVPEMTDEIVTSISERYIELYEHITGEKFVKEDTSNIAERIEKNVTEYLKK